MKTRGFSLIEIIVATGVFTVVAMLTVGSLFILTSAEKRVASIQANQDNVRFSMIEMTREIRNGAHYAICSGGTFGDCFRLRNADGVEVDYKISSDPATDCSIGAVNNCVLRAVGGGAFNPITGSDVKIERLNFYLKGADGLFPDENVQARVTIVLQGIAQEGTPNQTEIDIQTTISMLQIDTL
ncbi:MAG: prepilin-type N-terminal cleavage/methylation domain-containing protein [Patescibacteria group bacterium]